MRTTALILAGAFSLAATAAFAQAEPGRADTRIDDGSCYAKGYEAQRSADRRSEGDIPVKKGLTPAEKRFAEKCGVAVTEETPPPPPPPEPPAPPPPPPPAAETPPPPAPAAEPVRQYSSEATVQVITNGPVPDTPENRARYGGPMSRAGRHTTPAGN
jgi:hypothetical protein